MTKSNPQVLVERNTGSRGTRNCALPQLSCRDESGIRNNHSVDLVDLTNSSSLQNITLSGQGEHAVGGHNDSPVIPYGDNSARGAD